MSLDSHRHVFVPARGDDPRTLVLLHGTGGDEREVLGLGEAVAPGAARLGVRGNVQEGPWTRYFRRIAEGIYDLDDLATRTAAFAGFLRSALDHYGRDPRHAVGIGYSNGANLLANLLLTGPGPLRRAALLHPLIPWDPAPGPDLAGVGVLITGGTRDPICPLALTERLAAGLQERGAAVTLDLGDGGHELTPAELARLRDWLAGRSRSRDRA